MRNFKVVSIDLRYR